MKPHEMYAFKRMLAEATGLAPEDISDSDVWSYIDGVMQVLPDCIPYAALALFPIILN